MKWRYLLVQVVAFLFILLWVYAAASKLFDYRTFKVQLGQSPLLTRFSDLVAGVIPVTEIAVAIMLTIDRWRLAGLYISFALMVMFAAYIIAITRFSEYVPCSCGGILEKLNWSQHLVVNVGFAALAFSSILFYPNDILLQQVRGSRKPA